MDLQATAIRSPVTINCLFALEDIERATTSEAKTKLSLYAPLSIKQGHSIRYGEILYTAADGRDFSTDARQQPYVRSTLNGFLVDPEDTNILSVKDPSDKNLLRTAKRLTKRSIRVMGVAPKDTIFDGTAPGDNPVANIFGHQTIRNTGEASIKAGQMIVAELPDPFRMQILQRGGSNPGQTVNQSIPEHALHVKDKKVLATTPLHTLHIDFAPLALLPAMFLILPFLKGGGFSTGYVNALIKGMNGESLSATEIQALENENLLALETNIGSVSGVALDTKSRTKTWEAINALLDVVTKDKFMIAQCDVLDNLKAKRETHTKDACDALNMVIRSEMNAQLANFIGIATSDAEPGWNFDIMLTPPPTF